VASSSSRSAVGLRRLGAAPAGVFTGDYFQIDANDRRGYIHDHANLRRIALLGQGVPVPHQDDYLTVRGE
jgi:hypothetical protein